MQTVQIIKRKIDIGRFNSRYFKQVRRSIRRDLKHNAELLIIELVPNAPIEDRSVLKSLLHLQREFTDVLIAPKTAFILDEHELQKLSERFDASMIMIAT